MKTLLSVLSLLGGLLVLIAASLSMSVGGMGESLMVEQAPTVTVLSLLALPIGVVAVIGGAIVWLRVRVASVLMLISGGLTWILLAFFLKTPSSLGEDIGWVQLVGSSLLASSVLELNRWGLLLAGAVLVASGVMSLWKLGSQQERGVEKTSPP